MLVVEDDLKMASVLRRGVEHEGYAVDVAGTGDEAAEDAPGLFRYLLMPRRLLS